MTRVETRTVIERMETQKASRKLLSGTQALIEILVAQAERDRHAGLRTAGFVSGYRGSPLGGLDLALWRQGERLDAADIHFLPAINEELAVSAVQGTQQAGIDPHARVDGVFGMWYGKGPGVDRAGDALKHAHAFGSSPLGGVLVVAGDDHGAVSTSYSQQSEQAMIGWRMPVLNPADIREYIEFGLYGYALSRYSGAWVGFKAISEAVEATLSTELPDPYRQFHEPDFTFPADGLHIRWPDLPSQAIEERLLGKLAAVRAFARANPVDRVVLANDGARIGIVTTGKAHLDLMEALRLLNVDEAEARRLGLRIYKIGLSYPLEDRGLLAFADGLETILVVEEKRSVIEAQIKELLYGAPAAERPRVLGKRDADGGELLPEVAEIRPWRVARALAVCLSGHPEGRRLAAAAQALVPAEAPPPPDPTRRPYFCSGCPHSTSTRVPEGSRGQAGIGCHVMAAWMDRDTAFVTQMGGEGVNWVGQSTFSTVGHVFQNLGDGTYYHSGSLALRQAVAAKTNITFKILFNSAVAMTGGQTVDGPLSVAAVTHQVRHEGVSRIAVVSDVPSRHRHRDLAAGVTVHHRSQLDAVQRELRQTPGVSVLIYDQPCATEKRRKEKRGQLPATRRHVIINEAVCDGCGDCGKVSNCLSVVPRHTPLGMKRAIDQTSCTKDFSCVEGHCPSFVSVIGGRLRKRIPNDLAMRIACLPEPAGDRGTSANILFAGIGGTGVVTVAGLLAKAADLDGLLVSQLDFTGFAQKGGAVLSHVRLAGGGPLHQARIAAHQCDTLIACDLAVAAGGDAIQALRHGGTMVVANTHVGPTGEFTRDPERLPDGNALAAHLARFAGSRNMTAIDASALATRLFGDSVTANMILLGLAYQLGRIPLSLKALEQAIAGMGSVAKENLLAFGAGRLAAEDGGQVAASPPPPGASLDATLSFLLRHLVDYQDDAYAQRLKRLVEAAHTAERRVKAQSDDLAEAVASGYFRVLANKDEYEVARQLTGRDFLDGVRDAFEGPWRLEFHVAPTWLPGRRGGKLSLRAGLAMPLLRLLARARGLRGRFADPFRFTHEHRMARRRIAEYEADIARIIAGLHPGNLPQAVALARLPESIRGYGRVRDEQAAAVDVRRRTLLAEFDGMAREHKNAV